MSRRSKKPLSPRFEAGDSHTRRRSCKVRALTTLALVFVLAASPVLACPGALFLDELSPKISGARIGLRLFVKRNGKFEPVPIQVDPVDDDGRLKFFRDDIWRFQPMEKFDLMTFRVESFGERLDPAKDLLPCRGAVTYELKDRYAERFAYLTNCGHTVGWPTFPHPVSFDEKSHLIRSASYDYRFNSENYMQFDSIAFRNADGSTRPVALDSRLMIRSDIKNFFTMNFDSEDIVSKLEDKRLGPVGDLARVSFYLKILFFKIDLSLSTNVGFYEDSGHIPMMVSIPVNGFDWLNPKSGILYSWALTPEALASPKEVDMPTLAPQDVEKGFESLGRKGVAFCQKTDCYYKYTVMVHGRRLAMDFRIERHLVEKGFFPLYVDDVAKYKDAMDWEIDFPEGQRRAGLYFEVSGLPKGGHPWDFWLRLGGEEKSAQTCPHPVRFRKIPGGVLRGPVSP